MAGGSEVVVEVEMVHHSLKISHYHHKAQHPHYSITIPCLLRHSNSHHHNIQPSSITNYLSTSPTPGSDFLRPLLNPRSRSANNVSRVRSNSLNQSETNSVRQHRDSFYKAILCLMKILNISNYLYNKP